MPPDIAVPDISDLMAATGWFAALRPPPRLSLSNWCRENARLYDGSKFKPYAYQVDILDAMNAPLLSKLR